MVMVAMHAQATIPHRSGHAGGLGASSGDLVRVNSEPARTPQTNQHEHRDSKNDPEPQRLLLATEGPLKRAPSQKELACVLFVTTRHLRRWEKMEAADNHPCSRPYTAADLWRLFRRRRPKGWNRQEAARLALAPLFEQFEEMLGASAANSTHDDHSALATLMLKTLAWDGTESAPGTSPLAPSISASLARSAREQLRSILDCTQARDTLVRAFFEAALVADPHHVGRQAENQVALSA